MSKNIIEDTLNIYTDGSCYHGPRVGGIGIRYITISNDGNEEILELNEPGYKGATNNQMELKACIFALQESLKHFDLRRFNKIIIYTDSRYVTENLVNAKYNWPKSKWFKPSGSPVLNANLWKDLIRIIKKLPRTVEIRWVKGHKKDIHNKAVDKLAKKSAKQSTNRNISIVNVRRKKTAKSVNLGSVEMKGQRIAIHIITDEYLSTQKLCKYKYEIISKGSKYFENVDIIYSEEFLKAGHKYIVTLNKDTKNPRILRVLSEIEKNKI